MEEEYDATRPDSSTASTGDENNNGALGSAATSASGAAALTLGSLLGMSALGGKRGRYSSTGSPNDSADASSSPSTLPADLAESLAAAAAAASSSAAGLPSSAGLPPAVTAAVTLGPGQAGPNNPLLSIVQVRSRSQQRGAFK